jgi:hypothetical protein
LQDFNRAVFFEGPSRMRPFVPCLANCFQFLGKGLPLRDHLLQRGAAFVGKF